jgi:hypothetical protein
LYRRWIFGSTVLPGVIDGEGVIVSILEATLATDRSKQFDHQQLVDEICDLNWTALTADDVISVAWVYYYFSVQFRESLEIARYLYPEDDRLLELDRGERDTANLSPWPGVAAAGERMNHDEFMRRTLQLTPIAPDRQLHLKSIGEAYLAKVAATNRNSRALALASYEDGGLERVFGAILTAPHWQGPLLAAFKHFLTEHIRFDSDPEAGHGALCRHLTPDERVVPLWSEFRWMLVAAAPRLTAPR